MSKRKKYPAELKARIALEACAASQRCRRWRLATTCTRT